MVVMRRDPNPEKQAIYLDLLAVLLSGAIPEAEFLDVVGTKVFRVFLLAIHSHLY